MAASVAGALARIKGDLGRYLPEASVETACREAGHAWRERKLGPLATLHLFVLQVLHFNTAIRHLRHLAGKPVNAAAYCKARMRLPLAALQALLRSSSEVMREAATGVGERVGERGGLWCGLRALLVDGTGTITPDTPALQKGFGQPKNQKAGCGFPVPKLLALFDAFTGMVVELLGFPLYTHDLRGAWQLHPLLGVGDLLVGDRGFCSYAHLALLHLRGVLACFRMHQRTIVDFRPHRRHKGKARGKGKGKGKGKGRGRAKGKGKAKAGGKGKADEGERERERGLPTSRFVRRLGHWDQLVEWVRPATRPKWMTAAQLASLPPTLPVREVRYLLVEKGMRTRRVTVATTLLDPALYPKEKVAELYGLRWRAETHFAQLKTTLKMRKLKSQTVQGVKKELAVYCLVYNLVHAVMAEAAARQQTTPDRVSFIDALRWLLTATPGEPPPDLVINPKRPGRHEPRVVKDLQDTYRKMVQPRGQMKKHPDQWRGRPK